jgi:hypothetical protein
MYDFSNSSIYILTNNVDDKFYIGSTVYPLESRFAYHTGEKVSAWNSRSSPLYKHFDPIGWHNITVTLLEKVNCLSREHLHIYETKYILEYINNKNCLNISLPFSYYFYSFSKSTILNSSPDYIYNRFIHYKKYKNVLKRLLKLTRIYPTDYIYARAKYLFQFVLDELHDLINFNPTITSIPPPQPKKRGRPKKEKPIEPHEIPKKRGRPKKAPSETVPDMQTSHKPSITPPNNATSEPVIASKPPSKFSKKIAKIDTDSIVPLTSFVSFSL